MDPFRTMGALAQNSQRERLAQEQDVSIVAGDAGNVSITCITIMEEVDRLFRR
jgi:hypothetical protein